MRQLSNSDHFWWENVTENALQAFCTPEQVRSTMSNCLPLTLSRSNQLLQSKWKEAVVCSCTTVLYAVADQKAAVPLQRTSLNFFNSQVCLASARAELRKAEDNHLGSRRSCSRSISAVAFRLAMRSSCTSNKNAWVSHFCKWTPYWNITPAQCCAFSRLKHPGSVANASRQVGVLCKNKIK